VAWELDVVSTISARRVDRRRGGCRPPLSAIDRAARWCKSCARQPTRRPTTGLVGVLCRLWSIRRILPQSLIRPCAVGLAADPARGKLTGRRSDPNPSIPELDPLPTGPNGVITSAH
jgi:hypothetical protein